ncbi:hypothetical protein ABHB30_20360, partial [Flavonifractor plautii]|uniref:hypothetical protein n=1 Tax=Flavonifractor plautii TaxID=292800 RepID=UPI00325A636F
ACQELFSNFSEVFQPHGRSFCSFQADSRLSARTHLVYHALTHLSSTFFSPLPKVRPASARSLPSAFLFFHALREALN